MRKIDAILSLSSQFLNKKQLNQLHNILDTILEPTQQNLGDDVLIERFVERCKVKNLSEYTYTHYEAYLIKLSAFSSAYFQEMESTDIEEFLAELSNKGCCPVTINNYISCYKSFFSWLTSYEYINRNPMVKIDKIKTEHKLKNSFTRAEVEAMRNYFENPRDRAMIEFLLGSGVRVSELCKLKVKDLDLSTTPYSVVVHGKGNKQRRIPISDTAIVYLGQYLDSRNPVFGEDYLFTTYRGKARQMKRNSIEVMFIRASEAINVHIYPHKFRRTYCSELVAHGMALVYAQKLMGHATPNTTMRYTNIKDNLVFAEFQKVSNF